MKKLLIALVAVAASVSANAQFMSNLNNFSGGAVLGVDGATAIDTGYTVEVFAGTDASGALLATGSSVGFGFFDAGQADIGGATADVFVRIFDTNQAGFAGATEFAELATTASGGNVNGVPPELPGSLNFAGATLTVVPEPSTVALAVLGLGALALRRRKA